MKEKLTIALGYQVELMSNSLFYKLTKTFASAGYRVVAVGLKRIKKDKSVDDFSRIPMSDLRNAKYIEISTQMHYASGVKNFIGILN